MYALGHYGVALLVYVPVGFYLARTMPTLALVGGAGVLAFSTIPDYDLRIPFTTHRGITHTLGFALAIAGLFAAVGWQLAAGPLSSIGDPVESALFCGSVALLGLGSHILGDVLTPAGVALLWPLSSHEFTVSLTRADSRFANWGLFAAGVLAATAALVVAVWG
ncbi:metal-dependent hydrolase [Halosegnis sp.]|uniref:metal-dependent hydrolase n=1 Tax=Halosegnis sp. TaxID=2864959 RepID=UPI0035D3F043